MKKFIGVAFMFMCYYGNAQDNLISYDKLPTTGKKFLSKHFRLTEIRQIKQQKEKSDIKYTIIIGRGMEIELDKDGQWSEIDGNSNKISKDFIPSKILNFMNRKFPNTQPTKIEKDGKIYKLKLVSGRKFIFDSNENFLTEDK